MKSLIFAAVLFLLPFYAQAIFSEGENGYGLKKLKSLLKPRLFFNHSQRPSPFESNFYQIMQ